MAEPVDIPATREQLRVLATLRKQGRSSLAMVDDLLRHTLPSLLNELERARAEASESPLPRGGPVGMMHPEEP